MDGPDDESKARRAHRARLPVVTFDDVVDEALVALGIDTENDSDGHLGEELSAHQVDHAATLFDYMTDAGLIPLEE